MNKNRIVKKGFVLFSALLLSACATGQKQFDVGMQLNEAGRYKDAIAYFEQALEQEPHNGQYQQALSDIRNKLIKQYVEEGEQALAGDLNKSSTDKAKQKLALAREVDSAHPETESFARKVKERESMLLEEVKGLYSEAKEAMAAEDWGKAYFGLQQLQSKFPNYEDSHQLMMETVDKGVTAYYGRAKDYYSQDDFDEAIGFLRKALSLQTDHEPSREMLNQAKQNNSKSYFIAKARKAAINKEWDLAVKSYSKAKEFDPADRGLEQVITQVREKAGQYYMLTAQEKMSRGWLLKAYETFRLAKKYVDDPANFRLKSLQENLANRGAALAGNFKDREQYGSAWYWYLKIQELQPDYPDIFYHLQNMEDNIKERIKQSIAVFDFSSPSDNADSGIIISNKLITYLFKNASGDIEILERENLKSILEEMKLGQTGVVSDSSAKEMGRVYGIDEAIMGSVLLFKVDSTSSKATKSVRYKIGTKIEDNIEYLNWLAKHPDPTDEQLAAAPPAKVRADEFAEKDYEVSNHKKIGFVQLSFRIVDVVTGENIQVKTIERKEIAADEASSGLPEAGVEFDALEIPTDTELLHNMTEGVVAELGREALKPLQNLEQTYFNEGKKYLRRRNDIVAAENFVNAIFDEKLKRIQGSPLTQKAKENIREIFLNYQVS